MKMVDNAYIELFNSFLEQNKSNIMPYISFESGQLDKKTKQALIQKLTEVSVEITGIPKELFLVSIKEIPDDDIAVGGKTVTTMKKELNEQKNT
ncbi:4-oxalocrotonate tautomerase DmpI [Aureispira anguillae]|uniref:Tautomerase family protein n=1 Tax=Aureispira anguillae TaxID=2864201 RepID=A0A915YD12_9BACT|nr:4-oxalocrotonate tautomerase DmpI [Aureispira anguillae]BDS10822.1 tautomerase family protein [Aureispira anguillae]